MKTLIIAPHPDDEILGVGGTALRRKAEGCSVAWLIVTSISVDDGWPKEKVDKRAAEIKRVRELIGFDEVYELGFPAANVDKFPLGDLVQSFSEVFKSFEPDEVFLPHFSDVHSDHRVTFDAVAGCTKWFRYPSVKRVLAYETLSETEFGLGGQTKFSPNFYIDISAHLEKKLAAMAIYESELGVFPFPRSNEAIRALATLRGAASGCLAAEAFELLRERQ
ncbi:PIG-L family deacetylase [Pseudomonas aylmerensis]|jgi:LmbE family N-acetylglucosaminyl deacetylase|uniref:GlcNAc-PI de-N-acetylase n=1 Tax=Pseudomonas aylmerensis TaxID=1869229 RepID=A0A2T4FSD6_9PSED|nr:PIG-L family deacetylase [Pseudomonas aylmerensis]OCW29350.1 GlcNAc-PI de-N-acetylase [Pseudomonas aylmerensis]PTC26288.1 PIG-L family deacetylase [Pseudomonas aylmerensis]